MAAWRKCSGGGGGISLAAAAARHWVRGIYGGATARRWWWWWRRQLSSDARAFERHRHAKVSTFVLGRGRRDDGADCVIVGNSGARGDVHRGRRGADEAEGGADDTIC